MIMSPFDVLTGIKVNYNLELTGDLHLINCTIATADRPLPVWLNVKKFSIPSLKEGDSYVAIFDNTNNNTNRHTSLFIDQVYRNIMAEERLVVREV